MEASIVQEELWSVVRYGSAMSTVPRVSKSISKEGCDVETIDE